MRCNSVSCNTNLYFGNEMAEKIAQRAKSDMLEFGIKESIMRDSRMNEYDGSPIDEQEAKKLIDSIADSFGKVDVFMRVDVARACSKIASDFTKTDYAKDCKLPQKTRDAVAAKYLNQIAGTQCIDLVLYTSDFYKS